MYQVRTVSRIVLFLVMALATTAVPAQSPEPSGKVSVESTSIAVGIGVSWGDGTTSAATISGSSILGTHTYAEEGSYSATVTITDAGGSSATGADAGTIGDAALAVKGISIKASRRQSFTKRVASFTDADPSGKLGDYTATVNWGDGTAVQPASLSTADGVTFFVSGTHAYATKGTFTMTVRVADSGGFVANPVTTTATVGADD